MSTNPYWRAIHSIHQARHELEQIECDKPGIQIMTDKAVFYNIKLERVSIKAANILKQTFLAKGGECAVSMKTAALKDTHTDVMLSGTLKQYRLALAQMRIQPLGLAAMADEIEAVLSAVNHFSYRRYSWQNNELEIRPGRTLVMGILNVTPDSFSDGGKFRHLDAALFHAEQMVADGADILDIGAESTRPYGSTPVSADEEMERLLPILEKVLKHIDVPVSVDTYKASVAREALQLGAHMINDVWGLQQDPEMASVVAEYKVPIVIMHNREKSGYERDIFAHICSFLRRSIQIGMEAGIPREAFIVDPGIGFGKTTADNLQVMSRLQELRSLDCPILLGSSRKRFIGDILGTPADQRVEGTAATVAVGIVNGANIVRVHDVKEMARVARMTDAMIRSDEYV